MERKYIILILAIMLFVPSAVMAQKDDFGMQYNIVASKKAGKQWTFGAEAEMRTCNNSQTISRWSGELSAQYKITKWLKAGVAYKLMSDRREEYLKTTSKSIYTDEETDISSNVLYESWRPSYFTLRHRFSASLTGGFSAGRFSFSLRERWQYTYRPEKETERYNFAQAKWEQTKVKSKSHHVLRSRLQVDYDIPKCKFDPYANVELFNSMALEKTRLAVGIEYKIKKKHAFNAFYRYQNSNGSSDDEDLNSHIIGLGYEFKF